MVMKKRMNKKGVIGIIIFFLVLFTILILGFIAAMAVSVLDIATDELVPLASELGMVENSNVSKAADYTFVPLNTFVQALPWLVGLAYVAALIFSIVFAVSYRFNPSPILMGFYFMLIILLIFFSIIMSNMYEDIYKVNDDIGIRLQEQVLLSYMILYSPLILTIIAFITGIYLFAGPREDVGGGFGI